MSNASVRIEHKSEGWREILHSEGVHALCDAQASAILAATGHESHYQVVTGGHSGFGGGRAAAYVESTDAAGYWLQAKHKVLERAAG